MIPYPLVGGLYLGWALGANDASNVFGTAVAARIVSYREACVLCALAVILGAWVEGEGAINTLGGLTTQTVATLLITSVAAAMTVTVMTIMRLPISTSQAVIGAISGVGMALGQMEWILLKKVVICWVATPIGAMLVSMVMYKVLGFLFTHIRMSMLTRDKILWSGLLLVGVYGSYVLGANNAANATGMFAGQFEAQGINNHYLAVLGGVAIAAGVITFSRRVMIAVGAGIMRLDAFTALVAVGSMALSIHIINIFEVPVSTSQGIVGAIIGIGLIRGTQSIHFRVLGRMMIGWLLTPVIAFILAAAGYAIFAGH